MPKIDPKSVIQSFSYNPKNGEVRWKVNRQRARIGKLAGSILLKEEGRIKIGFMYKSIFAHQIAWVCQTGDWAKKPIDHINHDASDNRWSNLRLSTTAENVGNSIKHKNKHGFRGVYFIKHTGKWGARVIYKNRQYHVGSWSTKEEAHEAYKKTSNSLRGQFSPYHS